MSKRTSKRRRGDGSICKHGNTYQAQYVAKGPDGRKRRYSVSGATITEARAKLEARKLAIAQGTHAKANKRLTTGDYLDEWLADQTDRLAPGTWRSYRTWIDWYLRPRIGDVPLAELDGIDHIAPIYRALRQERRPGAKPLAAASIRRLHAVIHRALEDAIDQRLLEVNPARRARRALPPMREGQEARREKMHTLTPGQLETLYTAAQAGAQSDERDDQGRYTDAARRDYSALWRLLATTGLRIGEALALTWARVDLKAGTVLVAGGGASVVDGELKITRPKTAASRRAVLLTPQAVAALERHQHEQLEEKIAAKPGKWDDFGLVFCGPSGWPLDRSAIWRKLQRDLERGELPAIRLHDMRHGAATNLLAEGTHYKIVQKMLGHSSCALTLDTYSHVTPDMLEAARDALAAGEERAIAARKLVQRKCSGKVVPLAAKG